MLSVAFVLGLVVLIGVVLRFDREDRRYLVASFLAHVGASIAFLWFSAAWDRVKRGDIDGYAASASGIALLVENDPVRWAPEVLKMLAHQDSDLLRLGMSEVPATAAAHAWSGVAQILSGGPDSITAGCLVVAIFSFHAKALLFSVAKSAYGAEHRTIAAIATLFVPSALFWTSGYVKEAFAMIGTGFAVYGVYGMLVKRRWSTIPLAFLGIAIVASVKPYILFPLVLASSAWLLAARRGKTLRASYVLLAIVLAYAGIALIGRVFPEFGLDVLNSQIAGTRHSSELAGGGSLIGNDLAPDDAPDRSFAGNLAALPLGLVNVLLRPFFFEARSVPQVGAALENGILGLAAISLFFRASVRTVYRSLVSTPPVLAALVFAITFAAAVGLSSRNLGTLSRYRVPMMPAYVLAVGVLRKSLQRKRAVVPSRGDARSQRPASTVAKLPTARGELTQSARLVRAKLAMRGRYR